MKPGSAIKVIVAAAYIAVVTVVIYTGRPEYQSHKSVAAVAVEHPADASAQEVQAAETSFETAAETGPDYKRVQPDAAPPSDTATTRKSTNPDRRARKTAKAEERVAKRNSKNKQREERKRQSGLRKSNGGDVQKDAMNLNFSLTNEMSDVRELEQMDSEMMRYLRYWNFKGAGLAVTRNDSLVYCKGYGMRDENLQMTPGTLMRIASASKLITATAIMRLVEDGELSLQSRAFGEDGILRDTAYISVIKDKRYYDITVEQLLRHESGLSNRRGDPMFRTLDIMAQHKLDTVPDHRTLVKCVVSHPLSFTPGTTYRYSNFGYLLLSMIIEEVTGSDYEVWVNENVLKKAGCHDMHIARNLYEERRINESRYYMQPDAALVAPFNGSQDSVPSCYGGSNIHSLSGAGGWIASAAELARFVCAIDGLDAVPDIISAESRKTMCTSDELSQKPFGWASADSKGALLRSGTLDGSSILVKYYPDGECWIFISNTDAWRGPHQSSSNSAELDRLRERFSASLPHINLFDITERKIWKE